MQDGTSRELIDTTELNPVIYRNFKIENHGHGCFVAVHVEYTGDDDPRIVNTMPKDGRTIHEEIDRWYEEKLDELTTLHAQERGKFDTLRNLRAQADMGCTFQLSEVQKIGRMILECELSGKVHDA